MWPYEGECGLHVLLYLHSNQQVITIGRLTKIGLTEPNLSNRTNIIIPSLYDKAVTLTFARLKNVQACKPLKTLKKFYDPLLWMGFNCHKTTETLQGEFTFYH